MKCSGLSSAEFIIMKAHISIGHDLLQSLSMPDIICRGALEHHEWMDGNGYLGLRENDISLAGRMIAVADVFDALISARPYKEAWEVSKAFDYLCEHSGTHFDPYWVNQLTGLGVESYAWCNPRADRTGQTG